MSASPAREKPVSKVTLSHTGTFYSRDALYSIKYFIQSFDTTIPLLLRKLADFQVLSSIFKENYAAINKTKYERCKNGVYNFSIAKCAKISSSCAFRFCFRKVNLKRN